MSIWSILSPVVPPILVAAIAGCAVEPSVMDDESVQRAASAAPVRHRPHVLVANSRGDNIVGYAQDGAPLGDFIPPGRGGIDDPDTMLIGPDREGDGLSIALAAGACGVRHAAQATATRNAKRTSRPNRPIPRNALNRIFIAPAASTVN
jgi:hypothetical protein